MKYLTEIKAYSPAELASYYGVDPRTFKNWLHPFMMNIGELRGRYYTVNQVKAIIEKIGLPCSVQDCSKC